MKKKEMSAVYMYMFASVVSPKLKFTSIKGFLPALSIKTAPMPVTMTYQKHHVRRWKGNCMGNDLMKTKVPEE